MHTCTAMQATAQLSLRAESSRRVAVAHFHSALLFSVCQHWSSIWTWMQSPR